MRTVLHSERGLSTTMGSLMFGPMGSVAIFAAPILGTTASTPGNYIMTCWAWRSISTDCLMDTEGSRMTWGVR